MNRRTLIKSILGLPIAAPINEAVNPVKKFKPVPLCDQQENFVFEHLGPWEDAIPTTPRWDWIDSQWVKREKP